MFRRLWAGLAPVVLLSAVSVPAGAQNTDYNPGTAFTCAITQSGNGQDTTSFPAGGQIVVKGVAPGSDTVCANPNTDVRVELRSDPILLAVFRADSRGDYNTSGQSVRIPQDVTPGNHSIVVISTVDGQQQTYTRGITITSAAGGLPTTGRDIALLMLWGVFLLGFGSVLISATWRRWRAAKIEAAQVLAVAPASGRTVADTIADLRPASTPSMPLGRRRDDLAAAAVTGEIRIDDPVAPDDAEPAEVPASPAEVSASPGAVSASPGAVSASPGAVSASPGAVSASMDVRQEYAARADLTQYEANGSWSPIDVDAQSDEAPAPEMERVLQRSSERTADLVSRLQDEIKAWNKPS